MTSVAWPSSRPSFGLVRVWAPTTLAAGILAVVAWRMGGGPFRNGLRAVDATVLIAAFAVGVVTTLCCAWRWTVVARGLGVELSLRSAVVAYYRSLFLNVTLPGGVVGDVHRGVSHGRGEGDVARGLRAVAWERTGGQVVQIVLTVVVLLALPSPVRGYMPLVAVALGAVVVTMLVIRRAPRVISTDIRGILRVPRAVAVIVVASTVVVVGHAVTFVLAADAAGTSAPLSHIVPLAFLAMLAMTLPSIAGWGPREGATGWAFAAAGLGAGRGVTTAVVYGVMVLVACLPGAIVLIWASLPHRAKQVSNA